MVEEILEILKMFSNKEFIDAESTSSAAMNDVKETGEKKKNLMSVIASLTPGMLSVVPGSGLLSLPSDAKKDLSTSENSQTLLDLSQNSSLHNTSSMSDSGLAAGPSTSNTNMKNQEPVSNNGGDVMSNILHLLYQAASDKPLLNDALPAENDETVLSAQHPPEGKQAAFKQLMRSYANGTDRVREILGNEVNIMYECRQCRGIFRSLPNLIRHKTDFCNTTGLMSKILGRTVSSSKEDDAAFQRILDILHPPEPEAEIVSFDNPVPQEYNYNPISRPASATESGKLDVDSLNSKKINRFPVTLSKPIARAPSSSESISKSGNVPSASTFGKFFIGRPTKTPSSALIKPYSCPICKKQMVERKSVRRHLVSIHSLSVVEAYKAMSNSDNIMVKPSITANSQYIPPNGTRSRKSPPSENLLRQCVEEISLGPSRTIHVLPQEFVLSSVQCPVCNRGLCRRTNVRRHLLEAHNLIIKGEKKYFQLKDIARNTTSNSPTLRRLRHLFTVTNRSPTISDSRAKSLASPVNLENRLMNSDSGLESNEIEQEGSEKRDNLSGNSTSIADGKDDLLKLDKITFVESENEAVINARPSSNDDQPHSSDRSTGEVFSRNSITIKKEIETAEDLTTPNRKLSHEIHGSSNEPQESPMHDDDVAEDEPPPKKLRQLAPMVARTFGQTSVNGKLIGTATQVTSSNITLKQTPVSHTAPSSAKNTSTANENGVNKILVRRVSSDSSTVPSTVASNGRTLIKVELRNSPRSSEPAQHEKTTPSKSTARFDIAKLACFTCDKKFGSPPDIRRHLITVHSFTTEDALAACYDCSSVDAAAQAAGIDNGFDITNAKCLICVRFYFSRENLLRHLARAHHMEPAVLEDLKLACSVNPDDQDDACENDTKQNHDDKLSLKEEPEISDGSQSSDEGKSFQKTMTDKCTEEEAASALKHFPKHNINVAALRCLKCKQRSMKTWDFKVHLLKHLGLGFYRCKFCPRAARVGCSRSTDMVKHFQEAHGIQVRSRDPSLQECRVNYQHLWEAYDLPLGKT